MTAILKVLIPEETSNYILNPSFRYDTDGWTAVGSTAGRVLDHKLYGVSSMKIETDGLALREGVYYRLLNLVGIIEPITASIYVRGEGEVQLRLVEGAGEWISDSVALASDMWKRLVVSGYSSGTDDVRIYIESAKTELKSRTFYVDGAQVERKAYATSYCDGDQPGCHWNIMDSSSISSRDEHEHSGGRWITLAGECKDNNDIYITVIGGFGLPPLRHNIQSWAQSAGSYFQNTKILDRTVTIMFNVKNKNLRMDNKINAEPLHKLRQQLMDVLKPTQGLDNPPRLFSYQEGSRELFINMRYEAGLDGSWDIRNQWTTSMPVRFLIVDPLFFENNFHAQNLNFLDNAYYGRIVAKHNGEWHNLNNGIEAKTGNEVKAIAVGKYGEIYIGGIFEKDYAATTTLNNIAYWDGTSLKPLASGANGTVHCIAIDTNGDVIVGGEFTSIGGVACNRVARWNGSSWVAMGTGFDNTCRALAIDSFGNIYAGGDFITTVGFGLTYNRFAKWDGGMWTNLGGSWGVDAGITSNVYALAVEPDGSKVYIGSLFAKGSGGINVDGISYYDISTKVITELGGGVNSGNVYALALSKSGILYMGGSFEITGPPIIKYIARWNGSGWSSMGNTIDNDVNSISVSEKEEVSIVGKVSMESLIYEESGLVVLPGELGWKGFGILLWNGSAWVNQDLSYSVAPNSSFNKCLFVKDDLYVGGPAGNTDTIDFSALNNVYNYGSADSYPMIYIYGPGLLRRIENQTTGKVIYLNLDIMDNEEVFIDFAAKTIISKIRGDLTYAIIAGSDFGDFPLIPKNNIIAVLMTEDVDSFMAMSYQPFHWSADATVKAEAL